MALLEPAGMTTASDVPPSCTSPRLCRAHVQRLLQVPCAEHRMRVREEALAHASEDDANERRVRREAASPVSEPQREEEVNREDGCGRAVHQRRAVRATVASNREMREIPAQPSASRRCILRR